MKFSPFNRLLFILSAAFLFISQTDHAAALPTSKQPTKQQDKQNDDGDAEMMTWVPLNKIDPTAVCNDGSPAGYYWKKSDDPEGSKRWLVLLSGGAECYDEETCTLRWESDEIRNKLMTSKNYLKEMPMAGVYSPNPKDSPLWNANKAYMTYCSSDGHLGMVGGKNKAETLWRWKFRGRATVKAFMSHLMKVQGLGQQKNQETTLVFGGVSAGGWGAMNYLDNYAKQLKKYNIRVLGLLDAPLYMDVEPMYPKHGNGLSKDMSIGFQSYKEKEFMPKDCLESYDASQQWKCAFPQYRLPRVKTPFVLFNDQYDKFHISYHLNEKVFNHTGHKQGDRNSNYTDAEIDYMNNYASLTKEYLASLHFPSGRGSIYSTACGPHATSLHKDFYLQKTISGITQTQVLKEALEDFESGKKEWTHKYIDDCEGKFCNQVC